VTLYLFPSLCATNISLRRTKISRRSHSLFRSSTEVDRSVNPGDSFYHFANNPWISKNNIPAGKLVLNSDRSKWGVFSVLDEAAKSTLKEILESAPEGSMVSEFYASGLNEEKIEADKLEPIQDLLDMVDGITNMHDVWRVVTNLHKESYSHPFFSFGGSSDAKNSSWVVGWIGQAGLGLPDRDYYGKSLMTKILPQSKIFAINTLTM
jgi:putative endopeptidase